MSKALQFFFINSTVLAQKVLQSDALKPMRILIADDQAGVGNTLALLVSAAKHHVVKVVSSGAEAIRAYRIYKPDVVLMDYSMGRLNGGTACRYILTEDPAARIVFVSGRPATDRRLPNCDFGTRSPVCNHEAYRPMARVRLAHVSVEKTRATVAKGRRQAFPRRAKSTSRAEKF